MVSKAKTTSSPPPYEPTKQEREAVERFFDRGARKAPAPRFKLEATGDKSANPLQRAETALAAVELAWADAPQRGERLVSDPRALAVEFEGKGQPGDDPFDPNNCPLRGLHGQQG